MKTLLSPPDPHPSHRLRAGIKAAAFCFALWLTCLPNARGQSPPGNFHPLTIGDTVPGITIGNIINYKTTTAKLSDLKVVPLILDFFATWCGSCLAALPRLDALQKRMGDSLRIFVVDDEPRDKVRKFLAGHRICAGLSLPFITGDSLLGSLFPHKLVPHEVWIDKEGRVAAITGTDEVNDQNVRDLMAGKPLRLHLKKDVMDFDRHKPLLLDGNGGGNENILYRSLLTRRLEGIFSGVGSDMSADSAHRRVYYINLPLLSLYAAATGSSSFNHIILEVADSSRYIRQDETWDTWARQNSFCYELTLPAEIPREKMRALMLQDLNRYLNLQGRLEKRLVDCWALVIKGKATRDMASRGGKPSSNLFDRRSPLKTLRNKPLSVLIKALNYQVPARPLHPVIIDETSYGGNVDLQLPLEDIRDLPALRKALAPYGLALIPVKRELEMLVLSENKKTGIPGGKKELAKK